MSTNKLSVKELLQSGDCGKEVEISGWVRTKRGNKQVNFIALNDGSTVNNIQVVLDMNHFPEDLLKKVTTGAAIHVKGMLVESAGAGQAREIQASVLD
ncbi:MAG: asparagine--tRNA ligase, partial [Odoribacter sp.]|nr:asparagine--tRNA ligase [Odoribacter sp.]